jgi:hypothetical protein
VWYSILAGLAPGYCRTDGKIFSLVLLWLYGDGKARLTPCFYRYLFQWTARYHGRSWIRDEHGSGLHFPCRPTFSAGRARGFVACRLVDGLTGLMELCFVFLFGLVVEYKTAVSLQTATAVSNRITGKQMTVVMSVDRDRAVRRRHDTTNLAS